MGEDENEKTSGLGQKIGNEAKQQVSNQAKKGAQKFGKKVMSKFSKEGAKKIGASAAKKAAMSGPMMVLMLKILLVILIIIAIVGIVMFIVTMPGMVMDKLKQVAKTIGNAIASWFGADATKQIDDKEIFETLDYLEQMGYDLQGEGFLTKIYTIDNLNEWIENKWEDEDGLEAYKEALPGEIDEVIALLNEASQSDEKNDIIQTLESFKSNTDGIIPKINELKTAVKTIPDISDESKKTEILEKLEDLKPTDTEITNIKLENGTVRDKTEGNIIGAESLFLYNYLVSDNYVYTIKNFNLTTEDPDNGYQWWDFFQALGGRFLNLFGNAGSQMWGKGLIAIYYEAGDKIGHRGEFYGNGPFGWNDISLDREAGTLSIRRGWGENKMVYSLDGWTGRYGMPLEFLLSVHLATKMPDLAYDMTKLFADNENGTEIEMLLHPLEGNAETAFKKDNETSPDVTTYYPEYITYRDMLEVKSEGWSAFDSWTLSKEEAFEIMKRGIKSPEGCTYLAPTFELLGATDNGDGGIFDENKLSQLEKYGITDSDFESINTSLKEAVVDNTSEEFKVKEAMIEIEDEDTNGILHSIAETYGYNSDATETIEESTEDGWGGETELCDGSQHVKRSSLITENYTYEDFDRDYVECGVSTHYWKNRPQSTIRNPYYIPRNSSYYQIEKSVITREWQTINHQNEQEDATYRWVSYVYKVYKYTNEERNEGKDYITTYIFDYIMKDLTTDELISAGVLNEDGTTKEDSVCSDAASEGSAQVTKCCETCRKYVKKIMNLMKNADDEDFQSYTPYISKVTNHWYRDVYFVINKGEKAVEGGSKNEEDLDFVQVDEEYEAIMGERWTLYETNEDTGEYILYKVNEDGSLGEVYNGTQQQANEAGIKVSKKATTVKIVDEADDEDGTPLIQWLKLDNNTWSAYKEREEQIEGAWEQLYPESEDEVEQKIYLKLTTQGDVLQIEEGQRTETNPFIKKLFLNNRYFKYDGSQRTAEIIDELRKSMSSGDDLKMGALTDSELSTSVTIDGEIYTAEEYSGTVELTQNSLSAFSMLENTHTMDADYIYRDFKELVVELGYFTKEELTDETPKIFQWFIPEIGSYGYPIASLDKKENEFGTLAHSKEDYEANEKNTLAARYAEVQAKIAAGEAEESGVGNGAVGSDVSGMNLDSTANVNSQVSSIDTYQTVNVEEIVGAMGSNFERKVEEGDGYEYKVIVDGSVEYTHYYQFEGSYKDNPFWGGTISECGCGPTSCCNLLTGYGVDVTPADTASFLGTLNTNADLVRVMGNWGVSSQWIDGKSDSEYKTLMEEAFSEGKPVIILMQAAKGGDDFWTTGGHFVAVAGVDSNGNMITIDTGSKRAERHTYTPGIDGAVKYMTGILIPDEAPTGAKAGGTYEGYEGGEAVVSPVTGILLEYGTYDESSKDPLTGEESRVNVDFKYMEEEEAEGTGEGNNPTGEEPVQVQEEVIDKVGYAKILVLDDETYLEIENQLRSSGSEALSGMDQNTLIDQDGNYLENKVLKEEEGIKDWSDEAKTLYGYKEFAELYSDFGVSGYIMYIDGFKCELPAEESSDDGENPDAEQSLGNGTELSLDYFKNNADDYEQTLYEKEPRYNLSSQDATHKLNNENDLKDVADPVMTIGDKLIIKEGTVLGRTMSNKEVVEARGETYEEPPEVDEILDPEAENTAKVQGNYIRIFMIDQERELVENVEEYLKLDEGGSSQELDFEKFLYWLGVYLEGGNLEQQGGKWVSKSVDLNDGVGGTHFFGLTHYVSDLARKLGYDVGNWADDKDLEMLVDVYLALIEEDKAYVKEQLGEDIEDGYLQAFISIKHNYGNLTKRGDEYKANGNVSESTWTTYEGTQYAEALTNRRVGEWLLITEGKYMDVYGGNVKEIEFPSETTPFTDWCKEHGITNISVKTPD